MIDPRDVEGLPFYEQATLLGYSHGDLTTEGAVDDLTGLIADPDDAPPDAGRSETYCPEFADHPIPQVAQFLWLLARNAGTAPPWRVRVAPALCAQHTMRRLALALAPHAQILMTPDGRSPAPMLNPEKVIEFNVTDQLVRVDDAPVGSRIVTTRSL